MAQITHRVGNPTNLTAQQVDDNFDALNAEVIANTQAIAAIDTGSVLSVNAKTGAVVLGKADFGLGNVDNTSDANKPVSVQQASAIGVVSNSVTSLAVTVGSKLDSSKLGQPLGAASLDASGLLPASQLPAIALVTFLGNSASQAAMLALTGQSGDYTVRTDLSPNTVYIISGTPTTSLSSWTALSYPSGGSAVTSVAGRTGVVVLTSTDVGLGNVSNTSDATYSASTTTLTNKTINGANNALTVLAASQLSGIVPVTSGGTGTAAPALVAGTNITLSGTWPNITINSTGGGGGGTGDMILATAQTVTGAKSYAPGAFKMNGSTSGVVTFAVPAVAGAGTVTFPTSGTLATLAGSTFTASTLISPNINSPTGIVPTDIGLGNVVNVLQAPAGTPRVITTSRPLVTSDEGCPLLSSLTTPVTLTVAQNIGNAAGTSFNAVLIPRSTGSMSWAAGTGVTIDSSNTGLTVSGAGNMLGLIPTGLNTYMTVAAGSSSSPYVYIGASTGLPTTGLTAGNKAYVTDANAPCEAIWNGTYWLPIGEVMIGLRSTDITVTEGTIGAGVAEAYAGFNCAIPKWMPQTGGEIVAYARLVGSATTTSKNLKLKVGTVATDINGPILLSLGHTNATSLLLGGEGRGDFTGVSGLYTDSTNGTTFDSNGLGTLTSTTSINFSTTQAYVKATLTISAGSATLASITVKWIKVMYRPGV